MGGGNADASATLMQEVCDIVELGDMLKRLRAADRSFRVFGSKQHRYQLGPTLPETTLSAFESAHRIACPTTIVVFWPC
jgi:hypothetical protein